MLKLFLFSRHEPASKFFFFLFPPTSPKNPCRDPSNIEYSVSALSILVNPFCSFQDLAGDSEKNEQFMETKSHVAESKEEASTHGSTISLTLRLQRIPSAKSLSDGYQFTQKHNQAFNSKMLFSPGVLFTFSQCLFYFLGHPVVQIFLPKVVSVYGIDGATSSMMLSVLAISDFLARLGFGFIGSIQRVNKSHVVIVLTTISRVLVILLWHG